MRFFKVPMIATLMLVALVASPSAHEGHAHGDAPPPPDVQTPPYSTRKGCVSKRWRKPSDCPQKAMVASSALAERPFG
jgi:hypothetical protein